jgi:hypothetical protein
MSTTRRSTFDAVEHETQQRSETFASTYPECAEALGNAFNEFVTAIQHPINATDRAQIAGIAYASRILELAHCALDAVRCGNVISARVLVRSALEALFALRALGDPQNFVGGSDFFLRLRYNSKHTRMQALKRYLKENKSLSPAQRTECDTKVAALQRELAASRHHCLTQVRDVAAAASMLDIYVRDYALHSNPTHADIDDVLTEHASLDNGKLGLKRYVGSDATVREATAHLIFVLLEGTLAIEQLCGVSPTVDQENVRGKLEHFYGETLVGLT